MTRQREDQDPSVAVTRKASPLRRLLPLAVLVLAAALVFALDLDRYVSFETLRQHRAGLLDFVHRHAVVAPLLFVLAYALVIALSIPGGAVMTIAGGFLFGTLLGTALVVVGRPSARRSSSSLPGPPSATCCAPGPGRASGAWRKDFTGTPSAICWCSA